MAGSSFSSVSVQTGSIELIMAAGVYLHRLVVPISSTVGLVILYN